MFSSVLPSIWKDFIQNFKVDKLLQLDMNIGTQLEKGLFSADKKWGKGGGEGGRKKDGKSKVNNFNTCSLGVK